MTQLQDYTPPVFETAAQQRAKERLAANAGQGVLAGVADAARSEWVGFWAARQSGSLRYAADPEFVLDDDTLKELTDGLPQDTWSVFGDAVSLEHAKYLRRQAQEVIGARQRLADMGWTGTALRVGAAVLDPAFIAADIGAAAVPGVNAAVFGAHLTRLQRLVRGGLLVGGIEGGLEAYLVSQDPQRGARDILYAGAGAFILGGTANALLRPTPAMEHAARSLRREIELQEAAEAGLTPTPKGEQHFKPEALQAEKAAVAQRLTDKLDDPEINPPPPVKKSTRPAWMPEPLPSTRLREMVAEEFPELSIASGSRKVSDTLGLSEADRVDLRLDEMGFDELDRDYAKLIGRVFAMDRRGNTGTGGLVTVRGSDLFPGDEFAVGQRRFTVTQRDESGILIESDGESFSIAADQRVPMSPGSMQRQAFEPEAVDPDAAATTLFDPAIEFVPQKRTPDIIHNGSDLNFAGMPEPPRETNVLGRLRYSMTGRLMRSESGLIRKVGRMFAEDALGGTRPGDMNRLSASEWVTLEYKTRMARWYRSALNSFETWAKEGQVPLLKRLAARTQFMEEVGRAVRRPAGRYTDNPHVNAVADLIRREHKEMLNLAKRYQVKGFSDVPELDTYLMRVHNVPRIHQLVTEHGQEAIEGLIAGAIRSASDDLDDALADKIARGYLRTVMKLNDRTEIAKARMFSTDQSEELAQILRENVPGITDAEVEDILFAVKPRDGDSNVTSRAKRRLDLDETYRVTMPNGTTLAIEDLLENNAETLMNLYTRQVLGASAVTQVFKDLAQSADDVINSWDALRSRLVADARKAGVPDRQLEIDLKRIETLYRATLGQRLGDDSGFADALRLARNFQYVRVMNQVGFAQVAELGMLASQAGFGAILRQMPVLPSIFRRARDGKLSDEFLREIEGVFGTGTDFLRNQVVHRLDTDSAAVEFGGGRTVRSDQVFRTLQRGQRLTNAVSFMAPVNTFLQRMTAAAGIQKWMDIAATSRIPSERRLAAIGLDKAMAERITAAMRKHVVTEPGAFGRRVRRLNIEAWDDLEAASHFIAAFDKWSRRTIQENNVGNLARWMTTDLGRTIVQFRTFVAVAWEKQFLFNLRMRDWETFTAWAGTMVFGGLAYTGQQYANAIGRPDRDEFLQERLATDEIAKAAFQRAGWSSLFPSLIDTLAPVAGFDRQFSYGRTTQMANDVLFGNPTIDFLNQIPQALRATIAPARSDYEFSQGDVDAMRQVLPFQNVLGVRNFLDAMSSDLPERSR